MQDQEIIVFKCGGSSVDVLSEQFFYNIRKLQYEGKKPVIVHGGGPAIERLLVQLDINYTFIEGLRKTTDEMMDIVEMVLTGQVNPSLTRAFNAHAIQAIGLSGSDRHLLEAKALDIHKYGQVGQVTNVKIEAITPLLINDIVPIISPVAVDNRQMRLNVNADTAAGAIASALKAEQLVFVTDVPGVMKDGILLENVSTRDIETMMSDGTIYGGMIPKVKAAMKGLHGDIEEVMIVNGIESEMKDTTTLRGTMISHKENISAEKA